MTARFFLIPIESMFLIFYRALGQNSDLSSVFMEYLRKFHSRDDILMEEIHQSQSMQIHPYRYTI